MRICLGRYSVVCAMYIPILLDIVHELRKKADAEELHPTSSKSLSSRYFLGQVSMWVVLCCDWSVVMFLAFSLVENRNFKIFPAPISPGFLFKIRVLLLWKVTVLHIVLVYLIVFTTNFTQNDKK